MPPNRFTLFEHQTRSYADMGLHPNDLARREQVLANIERANERAGQEILHLGRKALRANHLVGVLGVGEFTFEILPKIDWAAGERSPASPSFPPSPLHSAAANLLSMLSYAYDLRLYEQDRAGLEVQSASWLEILTRLFVVTLRREILAGLAQEYVVREETLSVLRGRWDVQRQLKQAAHTQAAFDVIYDDLSADIPLNQVFRFTVEQLRNLSRDAGNQALLADLAAWFSPVALVPQVTVEFLDSIPFNRLNERFLPAFHLARLFLSANIIQLTAGSLPVSAFLLDMNVLFERFVAGFLARFRQQIFPASWQDIAVLSQSEGAAWYLGRSGGKNLLRLRPDLLFSQPGQPAPLLIADTKYKRLDPSGRGLPLSAEDVYQMLAYAVRLRCPLGLLLYPQSAPAPTRRLVEITSAGLRLVVATLNLRTPLDPPGGLVSELRDIFQSIA